MNYFDFHAHIILKQLFEETPDIDHEISPDDVAFVPKLCTDLPNVIETQILHKQLQSLNGTVIIGAVLYGLESYLAQEVSKLTNLLKSASRYKLSDNLLNAVQDTHYPTFDQFTLQRTLDKYLAATQYFNVLGKNSTFDSLAPDKIQLFFVVEGCHSLVNTKNRVLPGDNGYSATEIISNLDLILKQAAVVSVNLTHLQQSNIANHAFGMQIADPLLFYPTGNGLSAEGIKVVQGLFDRGICVDLKHMSYKARLDLRNAIDKEQFNHAQPLLCTHAGFTGTSFEKWPGFIRIKKPINTDVLYLEVTKTIQSSNNATRPDAPAFNMTTINLFDEEIEWIVKHEGMIGLSMDRRILGYVGKFDDHPTGLDQNAPYLVDKEYFSKAEWGVLGISDPSIGKDVNEDDCVQLDDLDQTAEDAIPIRNNYFYAHILLHIKHYLQVCQNAGIPLATATKHITIGSDFDGVINPFINCQTCLDMPGLKHYIINRLPVFLSQYKDAAQWYKDLGIISFAEDIFYNNGYRFISAYFQKANN